MDKIHVPDRARLRQPREISDDQEGQSKLIPFHYHESHRHEWRQHEYIDLLGATKLLAIFYPKVLQSKYSLSLPFANIQPTSASRLTQNVPVDPLRTILQNSHGNRRHIPAYKTLNDIETTAEAVPKYPGTRARKLQRDINDPRKASHEIRKSELRKIIEPIHCSDDSDSSLFLCWGKAESCHMISVKIPNPDDDVAIWQEIRRAWYAQRGEWRKYLPLFGVIKVDTVEISIAGQELKARKESKLKGSFVGIYTPENLAAKMRRLEQIIANYHPQEFPCPYNPSTGETNHLNDCITCILEEHIECPEQKLYQAQRELSGIRMRPFLTLAFSDPGLAAGNGLLDRDKFINSRSDILSKLYSWHCPRLGELQTPALFIHEGLELGSQTLVLAIAPTVFILIVVGAKFVYGDWGTAWNVGCFLVALATLFWMWANHAE